MRALVSGVCTLMFATAVAALPGAQLPAAGKPGARVVRLEGAVEVRGSSGAPLTLAELPASLGVGSRIVTGKDSGATIELPDGTSVDIGSETTVMLSEPFPRSGARLYLRDGTVHEIDPKTRLLLAWPKGAQSAGSEDGADFRIELDPGAGSCAKTVARSVASVPAAEPAGAADEPLTPGAELRDAPAPLAPPQGVIDIEISGDEPPKVKRR